MTHTLAARAPPPAHARCAGPGVCRFPELTPRTLDPPQAIAKDLGLVLDKTVKLEWHKAANARTRCLRITQKEEKTVRARLQAKCARAHARAARGVMRAQSRGRVGVRKDVKQAGGREAGQTLTPRPSPKRYKLLETRKDGTKFTSNALRDAAERLGAAASKYEDLQRDLVAQVGFFLWTRCCSQGWSALQRVPAAARERGRPAARSTARRPSTLYPCCAPRPARSCLWRTRLWRCGRASRASSLSWTSWRVRACARECVRARAHAGAASAQLCSRAPWC